MDADGTREGYELKLTRMISDAVKVPVVASGGGGKTSHLRDVLMSGPEGGHADAALIASMVHSGDYTVDSIKQELNINGIPVRL